MDQRATIARHGIGSMLHPKLLTPGAIMKRINCPILPAEGQKNVKKSHYSY
jgi:hypothetical protein